MRGKLLKSILAVVTVLGLTASYAHAQKGPETTLTQLPQDHEYQKVLRNYMATLKEKDFDHGVSGKIPLDAKTSEDPEYLYRQYFLTLMYPPLIGNKRGAPSINAPPITFTLPTIETPKGVLQPNVWPEAVVMFLEWDYPGNLFRNNRALKLRAFVGGVVQMVMIHDFAEKNDSKVPPPIRPDWHGFTPIFFAAGYPGFKDALPPEVQKAYETGLKMLGERMLGWGVRGETCEHDLMMPMSLVYIARAINDAEFSKKIEEHARKIYTDPRFFHPAGYWVERGGIDTGFGGAANFFAVWTALMTDWPFAKANVERAYRLRGHLILPEPDGTVAGPSHFNTRLGTNAAIDQFDFRKSGDMDAAREVAGSMITDEAAQFIKTPTMEELKAAPGKRAYAFNEDMGENPRVTENGVPRYINSNEIKNEWPWKLRMWMTYNFPVSLNPGYEFYKKGTYAHRQELVRNNSPLLKSPFLRGENFVRDFEKAFVVTRQPGFAAILHTGTIGSQNPDEPRHQFPGPMGLSGGQLSAFWTPATGSVILGMRRWMKHDESFDKLADWRIWPNHSVNGVTADGKVFTSARIVQPDLTTEIKGAAAAVKVGGSMVAMKIVKDPKAPDPAKAQDQMYDEPLGGKVDYARTFKIDDKGMSVETTVTGDGKEQATELYETIPVYLREAQNQAKSEPTKIEFQVGGAWAAATDKYADRVQAVRLTRFTGAVTVSFDKPRRVKLSPAEWVDTGFTKSTCRNVLIDLLDNSDKAIALKGEKKVSYRIEPTAK